jgi:uncharacterized C2H2 Zn-finger protein
VSLTSVSVERKIALIEPMVTELVTLEKAAADIDLPLALAREVAELHGYPDLGRMSGHLAHLETMAGKPSKPAPASSSANTLSVAQKMGKAIQRATDASHDGTRDVEHTYLEHLLVRARRSHSSALHAMADRVEKLVKDLETRVTKEEGAQRERDKAKALAAARVKRRQELKAELAALDGDRSTLPCPHPACDKVYKYAAALSKHIDKEHPQP